MHVKILRAAVGAAAVLAVAAAGPGTAQAAVAVPGDVNVPCSTAALAADITGASNGETLILAPLCLYELTAALPDVAQQLTIKGTGATLERSTAPGTPSFTILTVTTGGSLSVGSLSFRNGGSGAGGPVSGAPLGGAIDNQGSSLSVTGGTFYGNTAEAGGAIENNFGSNLTVHSAVFNHNSAAFGGAIDNEGTASVGGSTFVDNAASEWGGAILTATNVTVTNCTFIHNTAFLGGGLFASFNATVSGSAFQYNQAQFNGGAVFVDGIVNLTNGRFGGNAASVGGGGIYADIFGQSTISGSTFSHNHANLGGGIENENVANLSGIRMSGNTAGQFGGGVYTDWVLTATNSDITLNTASSGGGGVYNSDFFGAPGSVTLTSTMVVNNQPDNCENCTLSAGRDRLKAAAKADGGRQAPLALPGVAASTSIEKLALTVTRGHDRLAVGADPSR